MSFTPRKLLPALLLAAGCGSALAQAEIRVCDRPNLNGRCIDLRHGVGDLRRFDFNQRVTSFEIRSGTWLMCSEAGFGGRCEAFDRSVDNLRRTGFNNSVASLRPVRGGGPGGGSGWNRSSITLYENPNYNGRGWTFADDVPDLSRFSLGDRISSVRVTGRGSWNLCFDANYQRCRTIEGSVANLRQIGMNNTISSIQEVDRARPQPMPVPVPAPDRGSVVLYEHSGFGGQAVAVEGSVSDLRQAGFNDRASALRIPDGQRWVVCSDVNFAGRCATVQGDVADLNRYGLNDTISSLRRVRR
jgi:hypothetical protein